MPDWPELDKPALSRGKDHFRPTRDYLMLHLLCHFGGVPTYSGLQYSLFYPPLRDRSENKA